MVPTPPPLPTRFPCWCRAVYSWGGESPRDLGFIEGDLIECLNAGDGSWWTGKLRRNKTVGVFPSNFVEVLPDDFRPISRSISPLATGNTPSPTTSLQKTKSKPFRKPFEAYAKAPHYTTAKQPEIIRQPSNAPPRKNSTISFRNSRGHGTPTPSKSREYVPRGSSPAPSRHGYPRAPTPAPFDSSYRTKATTSPGPPHVHGYNQRARSPAPPVNSYHPRAPSPAPPHMSSHDLGVSSPAPLHMSSHDLRVSSPAPLHMSSHDLRISSPAPPHMSSHDLRASSPAPLLMSSHDLRISSPAPPHLSSHDLRASSPAPPHVLSSHHRAPSPAPPSPIHRYGTRPSSPAPPLAQTHRPRTPSPSPSFSFKPYRPGAEHDSPPPPAPPPHRNLLTRGNSTVSYDDPPHSHGYHTPRAASPAVPPSPSGGFTPSPLREAMDGVIEQLDALGVPRHGGSPEPSFDPWSPESFDLVHHRSRKKLLSRIATGPTHQDSGYESYSGDSQDTTGHNGYNEDYTLPRLDNYVERMETRLRRMQHNSSFEPLTYDADPAPPPPLKSYHMSRPKSLMGEDARPDRSLFKKKSSEVGFLGRTSTTKTNSTNASSGNQSNTTTTSTNTQSTYRSLMSGTSAGGISATSAGSFARKNNRARSALDFRDNDEDWDPNRPTTPFTGVSYHPSHSTSALKPETRAGSNEESIASVGGLVQPGVVKPRKANFIKRILEATKTGVASSRNSIVASTGPGSFQSSSSPTKRTGPDGVTAIAGGLSTPNLERDTTRDSAFSGHVDWVQVRQDVNRSNTLSKNERSERRDRCQMMDYPAIDPVDEFYESVEGDEGADGHPVREPINYQALNYSQVDKNSRFVNNLPSMTTAVTLATTYVCRPYRSDVQRLRAIFVWVTEKINWEEDFDVEVDTRHMIQTKRGCAEEYAVLVHEMCAAIGIHSEIVRGYLKTPGEIPETSIMPRSNHWWNAVLVDGEWRMMDCCLASPSNPHRALYSNAGSGTADFWWFLARPTEICWTHIPEHHMQQHICPPVAYEILLNLPGACPPYFKNSIAMVDYNTSLTRIEDLEMLHIKFNVPADVEVAAEVEVRAYSRDSDGDLFENGDVIKKRALAQAEWYNGVKRYTVKALLPGDEGTGILKVYAGKRGLMHSIKDIPHPLAFALPIIHIGENPPYEFVTRHPTPHAQRHDIYVAQPQCQRLALNNTFVFAIRQHPSSLGNGNNPGSTSPVPFTRPPSGMSMTSSAAASAPSSATGSIAGKKPAKLAIQTPGGKILRLMRKEERRGIGVGGRNYSSEGEASDGGTWETIIKCSERGLWRGLVLADRTARWCVFAEWVCVG
ncbi:hypothetical protein GGS21DRAFT_533989 [Xylaria nigripes]|nr:hypothetical protein GGS21DRAFT_533989 [Xylaria nigripes]